MNTPDSPNPYRSQCI